MPTLRDALRRQLPRGFVNRLRIGTALFRDQAWSDGPFDNTYEWIGHTFLELLQHSKFHAKPMYAWGVLQAAALAKVLGVPGITVIEFGVAGGAGLLAMEHCAEAAEQCTGVKIDVLGFDSGQGLPEPIDHRDQPNMWFAGQLPMDETTLRAALRRSQLIIGDVSTTVTEHIGKIRYPVGFVSFDLDLYSSTRNALTLFSYDSERYLPRVSCYFDDIFGYTYNEFCGERLAIAEFNQESETRKLSPISGLKFFVPKLVANEMWVESMYFAHVFDHDNYNDPDTFNKAVITDIHGEDIRLPPQSDWKARLSPSQNGA
ncbi:hypothetical protein [Pararhizobium haloflavum]|uniref:hypothetical protein n=1 Tax=Pararhizobium haloflavum TaxID=2037914 RepID=UPI000C176781|nr:hypothetical protein [Pararhizobium haloflavum]